MNGIKELVAGIGAGLLFITLAVLWLAPSTVLGFLPMLWRSWKGKKI